MPFLTVNQFHVLHACYEAVDFEPGPLPSVLIYEMANSWREDAGFGRPGEENISRGTVGTHLADLVKLGLLRKDGAYYTPTKSYESILQEMVIAFLIDLFGDNLDLALTYFVGSQNIAEAIREHRKRQEELGRKCHVNTADPNILPRYPHLHKHLTRDSSFVPDRPYREWKRKAPVVAYVFDEDPIEVGFAYNDIPAQPENPASILADRRKEEIARIVKHNDPLGQLIPGLRLPLAQIESGNNAL